MLNRRITDNKKVIRFGLDLLRPHKTFVVYFLLVVAAEAIVGSVLEPLGMKFLIDSLSTGDYRLFTTLIIIVSSVGVGIHILGYKTEIIKKKIQNSIHQDLTVQLGSRLSDIELKKVLERGEGYYLSRVYEESRRVSHDLTAVLSSLCSISFSIIGGLSVALWLSWQVTLALAAIVPALWFVARRFGPSMTDTSREEQESIATFSTFISRIIKSQEAIRLFNLRDSVSPDIKENIKASLHLGEKNTRITERYRAWSKINLSISELIVLALTGFQVLIGVITIGSLFGFLRAFGAIIQSINGVTNLLPMLANLKGRIIRIMEYIEEANSDSVKHERGLEIPGFQRKGTLLSVKSLSYEINGFLVFKNLNYKIKDNACLLLHGPNGCGKSTFANLLTGLLEPTQGVIYIHKNNIRFSALVGNNTLYPGSIDQFAKKSLSIEYDVFIKYIDELNLYHLLEKDGESLSSGEKKKIQIALCLSKPADLYVFDEPLANIDETSKEQIIKLIIDNTEDSALIVIEHGNDKFHSLFADVEDFTSLI